MDSQKLSKVVSILYDMELNDYYMTKSLNNLNENIKKLGIYSYYQKPNYQGFDPGGYLAGGFIGAVIGLIVGVIVAIVSIGDFWDIIFEFGTTLSYIVKWLIRGLVIGGVIGIIFDVFVMHSGKKEYKAKCEEFQRLVNIDCARVQKENFEKNILIEKYDLLSLKKKESSEKLQQFKNMSGIDKKFCNIVALGYMNEFIKLGISTKLEGADGLYYLVLQELRWDQMMLTMEEISAKLDEVIDNQRMLHMDLVEMNQKSSKMIGELMNGVQNLNANVNELKSIEQYNGTRIRQELEFQNFMLICNS